MSRQFSVTLPLGVFLMVFAFEFLTNEDDDGEDDGDGVDGNNSDDVGTAAHAEGITTYDVTILVNVCSMVT